MLRLKSIKKSYTTAGFTQHALDGVSVAFRDNEFAAVLGPSGSGKTTMLNIVGGLDRYDSGDLEIDGISTKNYKASDWDTYRNNRIGFVFQSYNLIPHQSVLANVELALTLSGVSKRERRERAKNVLREVGLGDHMRKKPGQLSGGQMQRVAIARALINDPEILLADEPTGALDSTTSLQVMEMLTEIAKDRLVIMVTHNNELAEKYANRIVHLRDGRVTSDSRPFDPDKEASREAKAPRRAGMSFLTAIALSFSNLMTKKGRTFTTAFAGSIGIIGIATILAFSNGINAYIKGIEEDTLSIYPLSIQQQSFDLSGFFGDGGDSGAESGQSVRRERPPGTVREIKIMERMFSTQNINDLASLKAHMEANEEALLPYVNAIQYTYDITPQIFLADTSNGVDQVNPDSILGGFMGAGAELSASAGMGFMTGTNFFNELPNNPDLYESQYDVVAGRWPESYDEAVLVLMFGDRVTDMLLYTLGVRDRSDMRAMLESVVQGSDTVIGSEEDDGFYTYDALMAAQFKVVYPAMMYQFDEIYSVWVDKSGDDAYMTELLASSIDLKIVGIAQPKDDASTTVLSMGVNYTTDLILHLMQSASGMQIVNDQLSNPEINVISGNTFKYESDNPETVFDFSKIISVDESIIGEAMGMESFMDSFEFEGMDFDNLDFSSFDMSGMDFSEFDFGNMDTDSFDMSAFDFSDMDMGELDFSGMDMGEFEFDMDDFDMGDFEMDFDMDEMDPPDMSALASVMQGALSINQIAMGELMSGIFINVILPDMSILSREDDLIAEIEKYMGTQEAIDIMSGLFSIDQDVLEAALEGMMEAYMEAMMETIAKQIENAIEDLMEQLMEAIQEAMEEMMEQIQEQIQAQMEIMMEEIQAQMEAAMEEIMTQITEQVQETMETTMTEITTQMAEQMESAMSDVTEQIEAAVSEVFEELAAEMEAAMDGVDPDALAEAFQIDMSEDAVYELMTAIMNPTTTSYEQNLSKLGYADMDSPTQIMIYPLSFEAKQEVLDFIDRYNAEMEDSGQSEKVVHYTDIVGLMMSTVTEVIDMVSYALVAFVSVALVVSSIMIGVITFVSVLERKKEIGILRAVGASKGNIRLVFNAETLIIGFVAGIIGVVVTYFIAIIANEILYRELNIEQLVLMPPVVPVLLVGISMFLTYLAGLIPASAAATRPPVEALRSE